MLCRIDQINSQIELVKNIEKNFTDIENEISKQFSRIIDTAKSFQDKMLPLNRNMGDMQSLKNNVDLTQNELKKIQYYRNLSENIAPKINTNESFDLAAYLENLIQVANAKKYFTSKNFCQDKLNDLNFLYNAGRAKIELGFNQMLNKTFGQTSSYIDSAQFPRLDEKSILNIFFYELGELKKVFDLWKKIDIEPLSGNLHICHDLYSVNRSEFIYKTIEKFFIHQSHESLPVQNTPESNNKKLKPLKAKDPKRNVYNSHDSGVFVESKVVCSALAVLPCVIKIESFWISQLVDDASTRNLILERVTLKALSFIKLKLENIKPKHNTDESAQFKILQQFLDVIRTIFSIAPNLYETLDNCPDSRITIGEAFKIVIESCYRFLTGYKSDNNELPADATIFQITANTLNNLEYILNFGSMVGLVIYMMRENRAPMESQPLRFIANLSRNYTKKIQVESQIRMNEYIGEEIKKIEENIDSKSKRYTQGNLSNSQIHMQIAKMNNIKYILSKIQSLEDQSLDTSIIPEHVKSVKEMCENINETFDYIIVVLEVLKSIKSLKRENFIQFVSKKLKIYPGDNKFLVLLKIINEDLQERQAEQMIRSRMHDFLIFVIEKFLPEYTDELESIVRSKTVVNFENLRNIIEVSSNELFKQLSMKLDAAKKVYIEEIVKMLTPWLNDNSNTHRFPFGISSSILGRRQSTQILSLLHIHPEHRLSTTSMSNMLKNSSSNRLSSSRSSLSSSNEDSFKPGKMDSKEKARIKEIWATFNEKFAEIENTHKTVVIPDAELRKELKEFLIESLNPMYKHFYEECLNSKFTSNPNKHMKFKPTELEYKITMFYDSKGMESNEISTKM